MWYRAGLALVFGAFFAFVGNAQAGSFERAKRMHDRLVGVPPDDFTLGEMAQLITDGDPEAAAELAMLDPNFYNVVLKNYVTPWTNEDQTIFAPLNDYTATVIGIIRDRRSFKEVLTGDVIYVGRTQTPGYSFSSNAHYEALEENGSDLSSSNVLEARLQSELSPNWLRADEAAGVMTTRAAGKAFFKDGTNRAMFRFTMMNHLCRDMEALQDNAVPNDRIRQDVTRSPGGDSQIFLDSCSGCHAGMDPLAGAFAYFNWVGEEDTGRVEYTRGDVQDKYLINANTFPFGYVTVDDQWHNYWRSGSNSILGWRTAATQGFGAQSLGQQIVDSEAFSRCHVEKVFEQVCFRAPSDLDDRTEVENIRQDFETNGYDMMDVFADTAAYCSEGL
ncbi:MAG: hypothetical protein ACI8W3_002531 [Myxococcota bacterium]|jgi:hypothetical protein